MSLEMAMDRGDAVFTFHTGTPPHTPDTMTATTYTLQTTDVQELNDASLQEVNGGFLSFKVFALFHIAKSLVGILSKVAK